MFVIYNRNLAAKVLKIIEVYKAKIAVSEDFALAVTFCISCKSPRLHISPINEFSTSNNGF